MSVALDEFDVDDGVILGRVRAGHHGAYGVLYQRHVGAARRLARSLVSAPADADDIVAEVFAATFGAIRRGRGPESDFVPYVLRSVRRECHRSWRRTSPDRQTSLDESGDDLPSRDPDDFARSDEQEVLHDAFSALPARMRSVLWHVEVDGLSHDEIARRTRSTPQAVAQLVVRARRALSERYLNAHLGGANAALPVECVATRRSLAEYVRGTICASRRRSVAEHLDECPSCREACDDLELVNGRLRGVLLLTLATTAATPRPWVVGVVARATGWLLGPTAPLTVATSLAVLTVIAPPPVFEASPPPVAAAAEAWAAGMETDDRVTAPAAVDPSSVGGGPAIVPTATPPTGSSVVDAALEPFGAAPVPTPAVTAVTEPAAAPAIPAATVDATPVAGSVTSTLTSIAPALAPLVPVLALPPLPAVGADVSVGAPLLPPLGPEPVGLDVSLAGGGAAIDVDVPVVDVPPVAVPPVTVAPLVQPLVAPLAPVVDGALDAVPAIELPTLGG